MAVSTFPSNNPAIYYGGQWLDLPIGGHNAKELYGGNSRLDLVAVGTQLRVQCNYPSTVTMQVSVDGGAFVTVANTGGAWAYATLYTGLSDAAHTVVLRQTGGNARDFYLDRDACCEVTGSAPVLQVPPNFGPIYVLGEAPFSIFGQLEGGPWKERQNMGNYLYPSAKTSRKFDDFGIYGDGMVRFRATCAVIRVWCFQSGLKLRWQIDGVDQGLIVSSAAAEWDWVTLATGLDTKEHEYSFSVAYRNNGSDLYAVMLSGGTGLRLKPIAFRPAVVFYGDSITTAETGTGNDSSVGVAHLIGIKKGVQVYNLGLPGSTVKQFSSGGAAVQVATGEALGRIADVAMAFPSPAYVVVVYGTNDLGQVGGAETSGQFQSSYQNMMQQLIALLPATKFLCCGILPRSDFTSSARAPWSAAIQAVVTALANSNVQFVATEGWIDPTAGSDTFDGVHPNASGYQKIVNQLSPFIAVSTSHTTMSAALKGDGFKAFLKGEKKEIACTITVVNGTATISGSPAPYTRLYDQNGAVVAGYDGALATGYDTGNAASLDVWHLFDSTPITPGRYSLGIITTAIGPDGGSQVFEVIQPFWVLSEPGIA